MGLADTVTKAYMKDNSVFADAFNYLIYGGEAVVDPKQLQELDTTEIALPFGSQDEDGKQPEEAVQKYRDVLKSAIIKQDDEAAYILLGIENQTDIHYAMPVRNIIYDALQYGKQVACHRQATKPQVMEIQKGIAVVNIFLDSTRKIKLRLLSRLCFTLAQMNGMGRCHSMR